MFLNLKKTNKHIYIYIYILPKTDLQCFYLQQLHPLYQDNKKEVQNEDANYAADVTGKQKTGNYGKWLVIAMLCN